MVGTLEDVMNRYEVAKSDASVRLAGYSERREYYREVESDIPGVTGAQAVDGKHHIRVPHAHMTTTRLVGRLVGELPQPHVPARQESEEERHRATMCEAILSGVYQRSHAASQFQSTAWHASVLGAGVWKLTWNIKEGFPYFKSVKPDSFLPKFASGDDSAWEYACYVSIRSVSSVAKQFGVDEALLKADATDAFSQSQPRVTVIDYWDSDVNVVVAGGRILQGPRPNPFGFIPYIVVKNLGPNEFAWGFSDLEFYEGLSQYYGSLLSQHADVIKLFATPSVLAQRTGLSATEVLDIIRRGGVIATMKTDARVEIIRGGGSPPEFQAQEQRVRDLLADVSFSPPPGAGAMSGSAMMEAGIGQESLLALKKIAWTEGQTQLNEYILRAVEKLGSGKMTFSGERENGVRSAQFYITLDDQFEMPTEEEVLQKGLMDPRTVGMTNDEMLRLMMPTDLNYRRLIDGHYDSRIVWNNRSAKQDPQYQLTLLNRFSQGAMSLRSLLEEVGVDDVEREVQRIQQEAQEMPWLRPQMMAAMQNQQKGMASGSQVTPGQGPMPGGEQNTTDYLSQGLNGPSGGGAAGAVPGMPYGGA